MQIQLETVQWDYYKKQTKIHNTDSLSFAATFTLVVNQSAICAA